MKCKSCGEELPERARFCPACGAPAEGVPAPKRLEEPLDPLAAGAVPMVPVAPPPRAYRVEPRAVRAAAARGERRVLRPSSMRPAEGRFVPAEKGPEAEKDVAVEKTVAPEKTVAAEKDVAPELVEEQVAAEAAVAEVPCEDAPEAEANVVQEAGVDADADKTAVNEPLAAESEEPPATEPEFEPEPPAEPEPAPAAGPRPSLADRIREIPGPRPVLLAVAILVVVAVVGVLVAAAVGPFGPFAPRDDSAPVVQPPSDGSIPPLDSEDEQPEEEPAAEPGELVARASVEEYSWDELAQISALIAEAPSDEEALEIAAEYHLCLEDGTLDGTQTKELELTDGTTVSVAVAGFRHDERADGSGAAGITFVTLGSVGKQAFDPSGEATTWEDSPLRSWMNQSLMGELPEGLADLVVPVTKETNTPSGGRTQTQDSMWLLSGTEIAGLANNGDPEGEQYQLFSDRGVSGESSFLGFCDDYWWMRGPSPDPQWQGAVTADGSPFSGRNTIYEFNVVAGFCL